jgi:glutaryl-CoA dehydrogenase
VSEMGDPTIDPADFLGLDARLTDEERNLRDTVRAYVRRELLPNVPEWWEHGTLPREIAREFGKLGILGMQLSGYGCAGATPRAYGLTCLELEAGDTGLRSLMSVQGGLAMFAIRAYGSEEQRERWLPAMAAGEAIGCFALTEPEAGSDPGSMRTTARRDGDDWILEGAKTWITNGSIADVAVVWARTDDGVAGFLVEADTPGFSAHEIHGKLSVRASVTAELAFDGVRLPDSARLPEARGLRAALSCLTEARFGIVWGVMGAARSCLETAVDYSRARHQFGKPIASFQLTQRKLADMLVDYSKGMLLCHQLADLKQEGRIRPEHVSFGKLSNVEAARRVARSAREVLGANGISLDYPVMRHMSNLETVVTYEGTAEVHTLVLGGGLTGIQAFR